MRQKLITLDPTSWDRAQKFDNFSEWVRTQLQLDHAGQSLSQLKAENATLLKEIDFWIESVEKLKVVSQ